MDMMSVKPRFPLDLDRSNLPGSEPKIVAGSHLKPLSGDAGINSPHHVASATRKFLTGPKVRNTVVAPLTLTFTPVGLTLIVCAITAGASKNGRRKRRVFWGFTAEARRTRSKRRERGRLFRLFSALAPRSPRLCGKETLLSTFGFL